MTPLEKLEALIIKLEQLQRKHQDTSVEIIRLREEVNQLKKEMGFEASPSASKELAIDEVPVAKVIEEKLPEINIDFSNKTKSSGPPPLPARDLKSVKPTPPKVKKAFNLEEFIGGNLINKIGILILVVGLGLFVKYAIDNGYFPPMIRLILSFLAGLALVVIGYRLKTKYKTYSAVLFGGGMSVLYFSAYGGNAFYDPVLLPRLTAFILMVVFTIVTVMAAIMYGMEVIALLGLVGAYAVPLLLSDDSGNYKMFLSYIAIINTGILAVTIRKNWRLTLYIGFFLTWLIFSFWVLVDYDTTKDISNAWTFNLIFFFLFYIALVVYNLLHHKQFTIDNVLFITLNAFIFYGLGMVLLEDGQFHKYQGLFTLLNGVLHLGVAFWMFKKMADKKLFYVISGLFWIFLTIAIGVQFDSDVTALLWLGEAALLFGIGRRFNISLYEGAAFMVLFLGMSFLLQTWSEGYYQEVVHHSLFINRYFVVSLLALVLFGAMLWTHQKWKREWALSPVIKMLLPMAFLGVLYLTFFNEIFHQFNQSYLNSEVNEIRDNDINLFQIIWLINYTLGFILILTFINQYYFKNKIIAGGLIALSVLSIIVFLIAGMISLNILRSEYLNPDLNSPFANTSYWIWIRYISYLFLGAILFGIYKMLNWFDNKYLNIFFQLLAYFILLVILSSELTTFMTMVIGVDTQSLTHRVGFSILWAVYSLVMILIGFKQRSKLLRVSAIILFGITLVKIFFLDLVDISRESRILLFVAIGILLLVISYLYQRYKDILLGDEEETDQSS